jgi:hypothetical protein
MVRCKASFAAKTDGPCVQLINNIENVLTNARSFGLQLRLVDLLVGLGSR